MWEFADGHPEAMFFIVLVVAIAAVTPFFLAFIAYNQTLRSRNIIARGWPPPHLDADGDFAEKEEAEAECPPSTVAESPAR